MQGGKFINLDLLTLSFYECDLTGALFENVNMENLTSDIFNASTLTDAVINCLNPYYYQTSFLYENENWSSEIAANCEENGLRLKISYIGAE